LNRSNFAEDDQLLGYFAAKIVEIAKWIADEIGRHPGDRRSDRSTAPTPSEISAEVDAIVAS
jgi:hypothetical protein